MTFYTVSYINHPVVPFLKRRVLVSNDTNSLHNFNNDSVLSRLGFVDVFLTVNSIVFLKKRVELYVGESESIASQWVKVNQYRKSIIF